MSDLSSRHTTTLIRARVYGSLFLKEVDSMSRIILHDWQCFRHLIEIAARAPILSIANDIEPSFGPGDGYIQHIWNGRGPLARAGIFSLGAEYQQDYISFFTLEGMDGA